MAQQMTIRQFLSLVEKISIAIEDLENRADEAIKKVAVLESEAKQRKDVAIRAEHEARQITGELQAISKTTHRLGGFYYRLKEGIQQFIEQKGLDPEEPFATVMAPAPAPAPGQAPAPAPADAPKRKR